MKVNFIDDVGQILLIWVSTFGTKEMVQLLFSKSRMLTRVGAARVFTMLLALDTLPLIVSYSGKVVEHFSPGERCIFLQKFIFLHEP